MASLTPFGKQIRKLRVELGETMGDMGAKVGRSVSFLSAVETGKKPIPTKLVDELSDAYRLTPDEVKTLQSAVSLSTQEFKITPRSDKDRELIAALSRKLDSLNDRQRQQIWKALEE